MLQLGSGSGMIMVYDIGCQLENLEFIQFHPIYFFAQNGVLILISEAIRGSGAALETTKAYQNYEVSSLAARFSS